MTKTFLVEARVSGKTYNLTNGYKDGIITTHIKGNKRSSKKSITNLLKNDMKNVGCKLEEVISVTEIN